MFRQARSINSAQRQIVAQRNIIRRYAIDSPSIPASTAGSLPPKPPTPLVAGSSRPVTPIIGNPVPVGSSTTTPTPPVVGVAPIPAKPVVVVNTANANKVAPIPTPIPTTGGSGLPPPPPPPPQKPKSRWARKFLIYLTLGTLVFYPTSAFISTKSDRYRDFFTSSFPLAEGLVDYADENDWDELSVSKVVSGAKGLTSPNATTTSTGPATTSSTGPGVSETTRRRVDDAKKAVESGTKQAGKTLNEKIEAVQHKAAEKLDAAKAALTPSSSPTTIATAPTTTTDPTIRDRDVAVERKASELKREAKKAAEKTSESASKAAEGIKQGVQRATETVKQKADELVAKLPEVNIPAFSEGVTDLVAKAENALGRAEDKAGNALNKVENRVERAVGKAEHEVEKAEDKVKGALRNKGGPVVDPAVQAQMVDTQRPRDVKANPASNKPVLEKKPWTGAPLPLGFEPPAGYYLAKTPGDRKDVSAVTDADAKKDPMVAPNPKTEGVPVNKPTLPLLAPRVAEFTSAEQEPIIAQLANTIDSLASSLSPTSSTKGVMSDDADPEHVLSRAQTDLTSLSARLQSLKDKEQANLQDLAEKKKREFEVELKNKESEWNAKEGQMVEGWEKEREKLVEGWRKVLDRELEGQRVGIEQRLREEVIAQGIELQRRWLRSIKAQVEEERGGRLSKLDNLTTSFKQLERITLDNSSQLDANVSLHTLWSALRAVQAKVDKGGVAFDDELRVLKTAATAAASTASDEQSKRLIATVIESIEQSHAATEGIKSFPALSSWFSSTLAPKIQSVSLVPAEHEAGVLSHLASAGLSKVLFRPRAGWVEGSDVGAVLARAEYLLNEKDLDGAAREVNQLQGWAGKLAGDWLREARKRLEVEQALQVLATEATLSSLLLV